MLDASSSTANTPLGLFWLYELEYHTNFKILPQANLLKKSSIRKMIKYTLTVKNAKNNQVYVTKLSYALPLIPSVRHNHLQQHKLLFPDYTVCVGMHECISCFYFDYSSAFFFKVFKNYGKIYMT